MTTKHEELQHLFHRYTKEHDGLPEAPVTVARWALANNLIALPKIDPAALLAEDMSKALREEYATDPTSGRRYRRNHAVRITKNHLQFSLWAEMETAPREHMVKAFQQRRQQIVGDCVQLKADVDVYNGRHPEMKQIPLILDFTDDVAEIEAAEEPAA